MVTSLATTSVGSTSEPTVHSFLESIIRHRVRFLTIFGLILSLTVLWVFFSPKKYESDMSLIVQNARKPDILSAEANTGTQPLLPQVTEEQVYSQVEVLGSADVLDEVADPGWRSVPLTEHSEQAQLAHEQKVLRIRKHMEIAPVRKSNVIDVSYRANDPREATATLQRAMAVFLAREKIVAQPAGAAQFFASEAKRYQSEWANAQQELAKFQQAHHIVSIDASETQLQKDIADALVLERAADAEIVEVANRLKAESAQSKATPTRQKTQERVVPAAGSVDQVNTLLAQLTLRRAQLLTEYLPTDRIVQQVDSQIEQAKSELANSKTIQSMEVSTDVNPSWQLQDQAIMQDRAHLQAATGRRDEIAKQVDELQKQLKSTESDTLTYASLQQKVSQLDANYRLYLQKRDASQISEAMNEQGLINIAVAQSPTFSLTQVRPRPLIDSILGVLTAFLMGCFAVYLAEAGRQSISSPAEFEAVSQYPLLATVNMGTGRKQRAMARRTFPSISDGQLRSGGRG